VRKISDFRQYDDSPFSVAGIDPRMVTKRGKTATMVSPDGVEVRLKEAAQERSIMHDPQQYIKVFKYGLDTMKFLNGRALCMAMMVMEHLQPRRNTVELTRHKAGVFSPKIAGASYYIALVELLDLGVIARSRDRKTFFVNPNMIFNGDRRGLITTKKLKSDVSESTDDC